MKKSTSKEKRIFFRTWLLQKSRKACLPRGASFPRYHLLCPIRFERLLNDNVIRRSVFTAHINHDRHRECGVEEDDASPAAHPSRRCAPPARASIGQGNSGGVLCPDRKSTGMNSSH